MHLTITTLAISDDAKHSKKFWTHTATLRRRYPATELAMLPIEDLDDPNNMISIWSNVQAADIVVCLISEEFLAALDDLTTTGNNLIPDELLKKRSDPEFRLVPIILSNCSWDDETVFTKLQALPRRQTVKQMQIDEAWVEVAQGIDAIMQSLQKQYQQAQVVQPQPTITVQPSKQTTHISLSFCRHCGDPLPANATYCRCGATFSFTNAYTSPTTTRTAIPQQPTFAQPAGSSILLMYSNRDKTIAQECLQALKTSGLSVIDGQNFVPGSQWRDVLKDRVHQASSVVFLLSSDFLAEYQSNDQYGVVSLTRMTVSPSLLASSYAIVIRYCAYDYAFSGPQPQLIFSVDGKPMSTSKRREESWFALGQQLQAQLA